MPKTHTNPGASLQLGERRRTSTQAAAYTITEGESGTHFSNRGAGSSITFTLPALRAGLWFIFSNQVLDQDLLVSAPTTVFMVFNDDTANSLGISTTSERAGGGMYVYCDGNNWFGLELKHDAQTFNVGT